MNKLYLLTLLSVFSLSTYGQRREIIKADEYFEINYYIEAIKYYEKAESDKDIGSKKAYVTRRLAQSNNDIFKYDQSLYWYTKLFSMKTRLSEEDYYSYAEVLRINGNFEQAKEKYFQYANLVGDEKLKEHYKTLSEWSKSNNKTSQIDIFESNVSIGDRGLGVTYYGEGVIYSKTKEEFEEGKTPFYDLVYSKTEGSNFAVANELPEFDNNEFFNGGAFFCKKNSTLYFTSNASDRKKFRSLSPRYHLSKDGVNHLRIYSSKFINGEFQKRKDLSINNDNFSNAHPTLTPSGDTMYFASNREGGIGGYDIYISIKKGSKWSKAENIGDNINTDKNEMFPFVKGNKLYFSSYGHMNYGGADLFESVIHDDVIFSLPENMGKPYNSNKDDFAMIFDENNEDGYFISNRDNDKGHDKIYYYKKTPPDTIIATAKTRFDLLPIDSVEVSLRQITGGEQNIVYSSITDSTGSLNLVLEKGKEYYAYFITNGYKQDTIKKYIPKNDRKSIIALFDVIPFEGKSIVIKNIYFDFDKSNVLEESKPVLDQLYYYMKHNADINVFIGAHTDCRGTDDYNNVLSDNRAKSTVEYLVGKGIGEERLKWKGFGKTQLIITNNKCSEEEHQQNRRVTFKISKKMVVDE